MGRCTSEVLRHSPVTRHGHVISENSETSIIRQELGPKQWRVREEPDNRVGA
jgi:hypothetical protein